METEVQTKKPRPSYVARLYEDSIKSLSNKEKLELVALVTTDMAQEVPDTRKLHSPMEFAGVGKHNPIGMDASEYIKAMRDEWDDEP